MLAGLSLANRASIGSAGAAAAARAGFGAGALAGALAAWVAKRPAGTARITGRVLNEAGRPAAGARVSLTLSTCRGPDCDTQYSPTETVSDAEGRFAFANVGRVPVVVEAALTGFVTAEYGEAAPGLPGTPLAMRAGEKIDVVIRLTHGASVSGTVFDSQGALAAGIEVWAFRLRPEGGDEELIADSISTRTDETGQYRIAALPGGRYIICGGRTWGDHERPPIVEIGPGQRGFESGASYPNGEWINDAEPIRLANDEARGGVNLRLRMAPVTNVSGVVRTTDGKPVARARVYLLDLDDPGPGSEDHWTDAAGRFQIDRVEAGRYRVVAFDQSHPRLWGRAYVESDGRVPTKLDLTIEPAGEIAGRIIFDGRSAPPAAPVPVPPNWTKSVSLFVNAADGTAESPWSATWDWSFPETFSAPGIPQGRYSLSLDGAVGWWMRSQIVDGMDALDHPFAIVGTETRFVTVTFTVAVSVPPFPSVMV